ncbi:MBL fold metallo-hydrolase [Candidatus Thorarchaeota archaeon]|nr:MAG: MBL fold metallo-hydrolase [Candidatus Thorarchaeota archaeon]
MKTLLKTKHKKIKQTFEQAENDLKSIQRGKKIPEGEGLLGESRELIVFELAQTSNISTENLSIASSVNDVLMQIFLDARDDTTVQDIINAMTLCIHGLIMGNYNEEDFRYLYRYSLRYIRNQTPIERWLRKALLYLSAINNESEAEILKEVRYWIQFLGAPLFEPSLFIEPATELGIDIKSALETNQFRLVDAVMRHPQYLQEAVQELSLLESYEVLKDWAPDVVLLNLTRIKKRDVYEVAQKKITSNMTVEKSVDLMQQVFVKEGFKTNRDSNLPVKLQELKSPTPGDAIDPVIFELIPQKLRVSLLPAVAYSTKTKIIEIIFLGGHRIGRSGVLIKTDTGGILLDYGLSVANHRIPEWVPEIDMIDTVLVSHSHLDHVGGLPVLFQEFTGKWCSVGPSGAITKILLDDALKVGTPFPPRKYDPLDLISRYNESNIEKVTKNHVQLEYGVSNEVGPGIVVTPIDACHIPGSAIYSIDIEGVKILYTGDFNMDASVLFPGANLPTDADYTIFDGTYWGREDFDREKVKQQISKTISDFGPIIIPSFAVGRSQEILLILEELGITRNKNVMVTGMAERVTKIVGVTGHWDSMKKNRINLQEDDVLVAGGGMMAGGLARHHFNEQRGNPNAAVILCGYLAPRTPGWNLLHGYEPHECHVEYARLSAHSSSTNLENYVNSCKGKRIMVHTPVYAEPKGVMIPSYKQRIIIKT